MSGDRRLVGIVFGAVVLVLYSSTLIGQRGTTFSMDFLGGAITLTITDVTDVTVTLSTKSAEVSGTVRRPNLSLPERALPTRIIIFPKLERLRTFYYAFPSPRRVVLLERNFRAVLPPGEYLAAAVIGDLPELWMTSDYLERLLPWATPIRLGVGEKVSVALDARLVAR
jgi:hypothetical protein